MVRKFLPAVWCGVGLLMAVGCSDAEKRAAVPEQKEVQPQAQVEPETPPEPEVVVAEPQAIDMEKPRTANIEEQQPMRRDPQVKPAAAEEPASESTPQRRTAFFRLDAKSPATIPKVLLSRSHQALCRVRVGDVLPAIELPVVAGNDIKKLSDLYGKGATVVAFWKADRRMSRELLADLGPDVADLFGQQGVTLVGVAVNESAESAQAALDKAGAKYVNLLDADGKAFAQVGSERLPRVYLVDKAGQILWFDIEYSQATRRELHQALHAVTGAPAEVPADSTKPHAGDSAPKAGE